MSRPFAVFDIDGTIIRWQLFHAIVSQLSDDGKLPSEAASSITDALQSWRRRSSTVSFSDYEMTLVNNYSKVITHISHSDFLRAAESVYEQYQDQVYVYTRNLIAELKANNYLLFAVSGSHQEIVDKLGKSYGFDAVVGAQYEVVNGQFTGNRSSPATDGKAPIVKRLVEQFGATWKGSLAIGDSLSDAAMLELVEHPIAFNPDQKLFQRARDASWRVVVERKNMIYTLSDKNGEFVLTDTNIN